MTHEIKVRPEKLPQGWAENIINAIIWGNAKHFYSKEPIKPNGETN